ncbi:hypothetical protein [Pseudarthrobacter sp. NamE5]|uniref:hypothetical protein n=1 Tax=Pseudarthrobacter sp. NamE5 TaxID=2576839 RepID=UPI00110AC87E|nr:hypothetical protein [Pseudarthrobacter sp. NamE5]TLM87213.1 hypothetical protein FDW84_05305 [Pseudarthrobacter sp. NamE5]
MVEVLPFPFATLDEFKQRWPDFPAGADAHATILLEDASQFILDMVPAAGGATESTRRRILCQVVKRSMEAGASDTAGLESFQVGGGPFQFGGKPTNPNGDFYLTKQEKQALGAGKQQAFGVPIAGPATSEHRPWCNLNFGATYCSCGADIAGEPIYEAG